jgi:hypothetical protein
MATTTTAQTSADTTRPSIASKPKSKAVCELCHTRRPILKVHYLRMILMEAAKDIAEAL